MSKKAAGTGIMRLLFGLGKKEMKVIPYNQMTSEQFEQLDRFLGKVGFAVAGDSLTLTKKQGEYVLNQIRQLDLYRKNMMKDPDLVKVDKMKKIDPEFKGFEPKVIEGGKGKTKPGSKIDYDKMSEFLGVKLRGDETFDELLEIEKRMKNKDPEGFAFGGLATMFRPKLKDGGPPNPGRRNFMKVMAGLASLPFVGKLFKGAKVAKTVVPLKNTTTTMPAWFPNFVDKMVNKNVGNKIDADVMLFKDKDLPGVELRKYDDGRIQVEGKNAYNEEYYIDYEPPGYEIVDETTGKAVKKPGDFVATDTEYRMVSPEDYDVDGVNVDKIDDILGGNSTQLEGYAKGTGEVKYTPGQRRIDEADARGASKDESLRADINDPYEGMDPTDFADPDEFAKGGLATMFRKK